MNDTLPPIDHRACLGLGSNTDPARNLQRAIGELRQRAVLTVDAISRAWQSPAVGVEAPDYVNAAIVVHTPRSKEWLIATLKEIEVTLGRVRSSGPSPRLSIDIDLLLFDDEIVATDLWSLAYRAIPVAEIMPGLVRPSTGESIRHAAARLAATSPIAHRADIFAETRWTAGSVTTPTLSTRTAIP